MKPLVSIITVVFNDKNIIKTIESIIPFLNDKVEAVIVDGNSTDGTRELIQKYADRIKILSETDKGIYDAINKGVSLASGTYILHINKRKVQQLQRFMIQLPFQPGRRRQAIDVLFPLFSHKDRAQTFIHQ